MNKQQFEATMNAFWLDWFNNYLSTDKMASDYDISKQELDQLLTLARSIHHKLHDYPLKPH